MARQTQKPPPTPRKPHPIDRRTPSGRDLPY